MAFDGVRLALPEDEEQIYQLLLMLHEENGLFAVSESKVRAFIRKATERQGGIIGVIQGPQEVEASVGLEIGPWWYTEELCLNEKWNFVHPNYRKSTHAQKLIDYAKYAAGLLEMPLAMGIISTKQTEAKVRLYGRRMRHVGGMFMDNLPTRLEIN